MRNVDALVALHRTALYLKVTKNYHFDLLHDTESMIGKYSRYYADKFGWVIRESGTHFLNPVGYPHITATYIERLYGNESMYFFWWDGTMLNEVTAEKLDELLWAEFEFIHAVSQLDTLVEQVSALNLRYDLLEFMSD